jgi:2-oxoacid:acceptor oxidoreductase gamma subunit (pyruvate/2-ketoisovalerate family)
MKEIKIFSRGGQGAVTAAKILVAAAIKEGKYGQAVPSFGQERKGAPVFTFARLDQEPISTHTYVYHPHAVVVFDLFLLDLGINPCEGAREDALLIANSDIDPAKLEIGSYFSRTGCVDAWHITREVIGPVPPNAAMLGAFARTTDWVGIDAICVALEEFMPGSKGEKNAACARAAYERTIIYGR